MARYQYITRQHQLDLALSQMRDARVLGVDTESSGYYTYSSDLCLIQLTADDDMHFIVDVLSGLELEGLGALMSNPSVIKIFHAATSDMQELKRALGWDFANVFDTLLACRLIGHDSCSLFSIVQHYEGVSLQKKEQKSNWKRRPLTKSQLDYANLDTVYLGALMRKMKAELDSMGVSDEFDSEMIFMVDSLADPVERQFDPDSWVRVNGALDLDPIARGALRETLILRDKRAKKDNIAPFRLLSNEAMLRIARERPASMQELKQLKSANPSFVKKEGARLLEVIQNPEPISDEQIPKPEETPDHVEKLVKKMKRWRTRVAEHRRMETGLILSNRILEEIARVKPANEEELRALNQLSDWKMKHYAEPILSVVRGEPARVPEGLPRLPERSEGASEKERKVV